MHRDAPGQLKTSLKSAKKSNQVHGNSVPASAWSNCLLWIQQCLGSGHPHRLPNHQVLDLTSISGQKFGMSTPVPIPKWDSQNLSQMCWSGVWCTTTPRMSGSRLWRWYLLKKVATHVQCTLGVGLPYVDTDQIFSLRASLYIFCLGYQAH